MSAHAPAQPPADGWVHELRQASQEAKQESAAGTTGAAKHLRVARAACKLRLWSKCAKAAAKGLSLQPSAQEKQQLTICQSLAEKEEQVAAQSLLHTDEKYRKCRSKLASGEWNIDRVKWPAGVYKNVNLLQAAACEGDVLLVEDIISLGAALDVYLPAQEEDSFKMNAPIGATALVLVCASLALEVNAPHVISERQKASEEVAIRLVKLGADCGARLKKPVAGHRSRNPEQTNLERVYERLDMWGKTARELAAMSKHTRLINAMEEIWESNDTALAKMQCRCGSRLPWKHCHAGFSTGEALHYTYKKAEKISNEFRLNWRLSPFAPCPCTRTKKTHFVCCWDSSMPWYLDDREGNRHKAQYFTERSDDMLSDSFQRLSMMRDGGHIPSGVPIGPPPKNPMTGQPYSYDELELAHKKVLLIQGQEKFVQMAAMKGPKTKMTEWDHKVVSGCMERMDDPFMWIDVHWWLDKPELLQRVKEWNEALEKYCDDLKLSGEQRAIVIERHKASPFAPCANPECNKVETSVKEYQRCAKCKQVGYCCRKCQVADWKAHKKICTKSS